MIEFHREFLAKKANHSLKLDSVFQKELMKVVHPIPTGLKSYDNLLGGGYRAGLHIIASPPALGKSSLALTLALNMITNRQPVIYFSAEMSAAVCYRRLLSALSLESDYESFTLWNIEQHVKELIDLEQKAKREQKVESFLHELTDKDPLYKLSQALNKVLESGLSIQSGVTSAQAIIDEVLSYSKENIKPVVFVDYLQCLELPDGRDERLGTKDNVDALASLANTLQIPVVLISSVPRQTYNKSVEGITRLDGNIPISVGAETGRIEFAAETQTALYPDLTDSRFSGSELTMNDWTEYAKAPMLLAVSKNRSGKTGYALQGDKNAIYFNRKYYKFEEN